MGQRNGRAARLTATAGVFAIVAAILLATWVDDAEPVGDMGMASK
jgi:hypothetical protein